MTRESSLVAAAEAARRGSYAPYSRFTVGAAIASKDGHVYTGANVENASLGLSMCAERVALFHAVTSGRRDFDAIAIVGPPDGHALTPCGACRQVLWEFGRGLKVVTVEAGQPVVKPLSDYLPDAFGPARLHDHHEREAVGQVGR